MNNDKWNEICFLLSDKIKTGISESDFEQNVIQALRVLGWKEFLGDIQIRPPFQIGASNSIKPDFVINSSEKKNLFVIEIKQPSIPLNTNFQRQLFSYMRQLRLQYGLLIGQVIQIFYDGDLTNHDDPVLLETIDFEIDNSKGLKFVELFSKESFSYELLQSFTLKSLKRINRKVEQKKLRKKVLSTDYQSELLELIKQNLLNKYDAELINNVLQEVKINITAKNQIEVEELKHQENVRQRVENISKRDNTRYILNKNSDLLFKNRFVLEVVREYLKRNPKTFEELKEVFPDKMQGSGVINKLSFVETKYANKSNKRHFIREDEILVSKDNIKFVVSTEWAIGNINNIVNFARKEGFEVEEV